MNTKYIFMMGLFCATAPFQNALATYWNWAPGGNSNWNISLNWYDNTYNNGLPGSSDTVYFDGSWDNSNCTLNVNVTVGRIEFINGYSGQLIQGTYTLTVNGPLIMSAGTFSGGSANITVTNLTLNAGSSYTSTSATLQIGSGGMSKNALATFTHNSGTVLFRNGTISISGTITFYDLKFECTIPAPQTITVNDDLTVNDSLVLRTTASNRNITLNKGTGNGYLNVAGTLRNASGGNTGGGGTATIILNGSSTQTIIAPTTAGYSPVCNFEIGGSTSRTITFGGATQIVTIGSSNTFTLSGSANLTLNTGTFAVRGNMTITNSGTGGGGSATILFDATSGTQTLTGSGTAGNGRLPIVTINNSGATLNFASIISIDSTFTYTAGTVSAGTSTINFLDCTVDPQAVTTLAFNHLIVDGTVTLGGNLDVNGNLTINSGGDLNTSATNYSVNAAGTWTNNGSFTANAGTVTFDGGGAQTITGTSATSFFDLIINNAFGVSLSTDANILPAGTITLTTGVFTTTGFTFTLQSTANDNAGRIGPLGSGSLTGNFTQQRYKDGNASYMGFHSPVAGGDIEGLDDDMYTSGFTGSDSATFWYNSVYFYNETAAGGKDNGWTGATNSNQQIDDGAGILAWVSDGPSTITKTFDMTGTLASGTNSGNVTFNLSYTASGGPDEDGWNLVGNPYPSNIDWSAVGRTFVGAVAYVYDPSISDYVNIDATGCGGSCQIASMQAFFAQATAGAASLAFEEADKTTGGSFYKVTPYGRERLFLQINGSGYSDNAEFRIDSGAAPFYEPLTEAYNFYSYDTLRPNISTLSSDNILLAINSYPDSDQTIIVPVQVKVGIPGTYTVSADPALFDESRCLFLEDLTDSSITDIRSTPSKSFNFPTTADVVRFKLHIGASLHTDFMDVTCVGNDNGRIIALPPGSGPWNIEWYSLIDTTYTLLNTTLNSTSADTLGSLAAGTYAIHITDTNLICGNIWKTIVINNTPVMNATAVQTDVDCFGNASGMIDVNPSGGIGAYTFSWSDNSTTEDVSALQASNYLVTITDSQGCSIIQTYTITQPAPLSATSMVSPSVCYGESEGDIDITGTGGILPYTYQWSTGATTEDILFLPSGNYVLTLTDNRNCTIQPNFTVGQPAPLLLSAAVSDISCNGSTDGLIDLTVNGGIAPYSVTWSNGIQTEDIDSLSKGSYSVEVFDANYCLADSIFLINEPFPLVVTSVKTNITCYGLNNGSVDITPTGGTLPYSFNWSNSSTNEDISGLAAGIYSVTVTDANSCIGAVQATVSEPSVLAASVTITNTTCNGSNDGTANLTPGGGTPPYAFLWSNSETTEDISNLAPATFTVAVTDNNSCTAFQSVSITEPLPVAGTIAGSDATCFGYTDGSADLTPSGGTGAYTYLWSNSALTEDVNGLAGGIYTVTIFDANNCTGTVQATVTEPAEVIAAFTASDDTVNLAVSGLVDFMNASSNAASYSWNFGDSSTSTMTDPSHTYVDTGSFNVMLIAFDANNCTDTSWMDIFVDYILDIISHDPSGIRIFKVNDKLIFTFNLANTSGAKIELFNPAGQCLRNIALAGVHQNVFAVNLSTLPKGVYVARVTTNERTVMHKFLY